MDNLSAFDELEELVGMREIKVELKNLIQFLKIEKLRMEKGLPANSISLHSVFLGPPGTGKTTVARIIGKIYAEMGFLTSGHVIETDRAGLVAGYLGQTAIKVEETVQAALNGILFIDEAYALKQYNDDSYGQEAIDTLLKRMEDERKRLIVIVAGYEDEMKKFFDSNPGMKSRFTRYYHFQDYQPYELLTIYKLLAGQAHYTIEVEAIQQLDKLFTYLYSIKDKSFGNGRLVRNVYEKTIQRLANRLAVLNKVQTQDLITIKGEDIPLSDYGLDNGNKNGKIILPQFSKKVQFEITNPEVINGLTKLPIENEKLKSEFLTNSLINEAVEVEIVFDKIADWLFNRVVLCVDNESFRFIEIEFYYYSDKHPDTYTYRKKEQLEHGRWYDHSSGIDLTFGDEKSNYGGVLIRGIKNLKNEKYISKPLIIKEIITKAWISKNIFSNLEASTLKEEMYIKVRRVNLNPNKNPLFYNKSYRYIIEYNIHHKFADKERALYDLYSTQLMEKEQVFSILGYKINFDRFAK